MRNRTLGALVASMALGLGLAAPAVAAPTEVEVRIEGLNGTIFDHTLTADGRTIQAASDSQSRTCDGTNNGANPTPGPTPTSVSVDAMDLLGTDFDGDWYDSFDDYFVTRWADEAQDGGQGFYWGVLIEGAFTPVGGCQAQLTAGQESLWANDAFSGRPFLRLDGPETVTVSEPASYVVISNSGDGLTGTAYEGATVGGVTGAAKPVPGDVLEEGTSDSAGSASVTFNDPGWHRVKASDPSDGPVDDAVPSNSVEVCVEEVVGEGCEGRPLGERPFSLVPVIENRPEVRGPAQVGGTLRAETGSWTEYPTGYEYEWRRCDTDAGACAAIPGATGAEYVATDADEGSTLRVEVTALNDEGESAPELSTASSQIVGGGSSEALSLKLRALRADGREGVVALRSSAAGTVELRSYRFSAPATDDVGSGRDTVDVRLTPEATRAVRKRGRIVIRVRGVLSTGEATARDSAALVLKRG